MDNGGHPNFVPSRLREFCTRGSLALTSMDGRLFLACALTAGALVACQSDTQGTPTTSPQSPAEPSFPTSRPSPSRPTAAAPTHSPPSSPSAPVSPPAAEVLPPQESGYVF